MQNFITNFYEEYGTATLVDAAFRAGVEFRVPSAALNPVNPQHKLAGSVLTVQANNDLIAVLEALHEAEESQVIVINNAQTEVAILGDLIATEAKRKKLSGFVIDGFVRDVPVLLELGLPVICRGSTPLGPLKLDSSQKGLGQTNISIEVGGVTASPRDVVFGDADGVIFLRQRDLEAVFEQALISQQREEDLFAELAKGQSLGDLLELETFLKQRRQDPTANFNEHLNRIGRAL